MNQVSVNSFIEDTSVLIAVAFLFVRGAVAERLAVPAWVGVACGAVGASEAVFPDARFPYASHTLACTLAVVLGGWSAGVLAAVITLAVTVLLRPWAEVPVTAAQLTVVVGLLSLLPRPEKGKGIFTAVYVVAAQTLAVLLAQFLPWKRDSFDSPWTIAANPLGVLLVVLVVQDALLRATSEKNREDVIEAKRVAAEAQFAAIRARVQPHFLFNALNTINALCQLDPIRASRATTMLGSLMRHTLEADYSKGHPLGQELEVVKSYLAIEQERFGDRLQFEFDVDGFESVQVPEMGVQILVENAILHGISPRSGPGKVCVSARASGDFTVIAVSDDGVGLSEAGWHRSTIHGLEVLESQLKAQSGAGARLRVLRRPVRGTLAVMRLPNQEGGKA